MTAPMRESQAAPRWSVMIPTHDCAGYLRHALGSVLAQDPGSDVMQIEVVDDHSTSDDPAAVVAELARDRAGFFRQPRNVGHVANFNTCIARARGDLVHILHGDDAVEPGFYAAMEGAFADPAVGAAFCRQRIMNEYGRIIGLSKLERATPGVLEGWIDTIGAGQRLQTPAMVVRRSVYEQVGGFDPRLSYCEDWEMWVRIAAAFPVWYEPQPLAVYRMHTASSSGQKMRTGENIRDLRRGVEINRSHLPPDRADTISRQAIVNIGLGALSRARHAFKQGDHRTGLVQVQEAFRTSRSPRVMARAAKLAALWAGRYAWRRRRTA